MKDKKEVITEEGFALKLYPRETKTFSIEISVETMRARKKSVERDLPVEALLKFYIGQGLRQDDEDEARDLAVKRLASRKGGKKNDVDLAA